MAKDKKSIEFTAKNVKAFSAWLKRFSLIDNSLLLEIDQPSSTFIAKSYNDERSVVKMSTIKFDEAGLDTKPLKDNKRVKIGIYNIPRLIKIMDQFNDQEFTFTIEFQEIIGDNDTQYAAEKILLKNKNLKMSVDCTSLNIFKYISDELFSGTIATIDGVGKFELLKQSIEKINLLNNLDNENRFMQFAIKDEKLYVSGKAYELLIEDSEIKEPIQISIFKAQYSTLDVESYTVEMGEDRLVFRSNDSNTVNVISRAETDESK
jgi:hypothetical protein